MQNNYIGCIDNQTEEQKQVNFKLDEVCLAPEPVVWEEKAYFKSYPIRNQDGSYQCVCMTLATEMGILFSQKYEHWIDFSSSFPYLQRTNTSEGGCTSADIYSVFPKIGNVFESIMPSQNMSESDVEKVELKNYYKDLALPFTVKRVELPLDFETVCSTIQATKKGVMLWFRFNSQEWTNKPTVSINPLTSGHSVTAVDFGLIGGKKYIVIQDSWGLDQADKGLRYISEGYFNARCFLASYLKTFQTLKVIDTERPIFDGSVKSLQDILKFEGFMASNIDSTGFFGTITKNALIKFQLKHNISPALGVFGPITMEYLTNNYK